MKPLRLEDADQNTFLETSFKVNPGTIVQSQKNEADLRYMWKYMHFRSHMAYKQKRAVMIAALKKTQALASNPVTTIYGAFKKDKRIRKTWVP